MIEFYDKKKIGKCISWGSDHTVYEYGSDEVIKFSLIDFFLGSNQKTLDDYAISRKYFGKYLLETRPVFSQKNSRMATIQKKIVGSHLTIKELLKPSVRAEFNEIMKGYDQMLHDGYPQIDLLGYGGVFNESLSNIFVTPEEYLYIIDSSLLEIKGNRGNILTWVFILVVGPVARRRQKKIINIFRSLK